MNLKLLSAPFPKQDVHWRAQALTKDGDKALALAYIDARDVMDRFDLVCGPENWQCEHVETPKGRIISRIGILFGDRWIWKSDGAGETAVEGEKGGISDALKRAAVPWGVGRYLYRLGSPWVPCSSYPRNGKMIWENWTENPWDHVKDAPVSPDEVARSIFQSLKSGTPVKEVQDGSKDELSLVKALVPNVYQDHIRPLLEAA